METGYQNIHQALIDSCRKGKRKAQSELYRIYYKGMYAVCLRMVGNPVDAEDVMQEAFLSAFSKIETYKGQVSFGAWLKKIVVNRSLDFLKKKKIQFEDVEKHTKIIDDSDFEPREVDVQKIRTSIQMLPDNYRVILSLHLIEGYDYEEMEQILDISQNTCRIQFMRAKNKLRGILKTQEIYIYN